MYKKTSFTYHIASVYLWVWDLGEEGERVESLGGGVPHHEAPLLVLALQHRLRPLPRHVRHVPEVFSEMILDLMVWSSQGFP